MFTKKQKTKGELNRRDFVRLVALAGGGGAAYLAMRELGLLAQGRKSPPRLEGQANGEQVLILGAGLAGLTAAYELDRLGYTCTLLEAQERAGGRCWTVRRGSRKVELDGRELVAEFDEGQYFNPGPARIPQHHASTLHYCRELGLELELFANHNAASWLYVEGRGELSGQRVRRREATWDLAGYSSELLAKAVDRGALDEELSAQDQERLLDYLNDYGGLDGAGRYAGSARRGYERWPGGYEQAGELGAPEELSPLLEADFWGLISRDADIHQQMNMFQVRGGTDGLAKALVEAVESPIEYGAEVRAIRQAGVGIEVEYVQEGVERKLSGDFCVCTLPLPLLDRVENDFSAAKQSAISQVSYVPSGKMGLQFGRRFWEEDEGIYGGISRNNLAIGQIWYPSTGYLGQKGIVVGYYNFGPEAAALGRLDDAERLELALEQGEKLHPDYRRHFESSFSVAWEQMAYARGAFAYFTEAQRASAYEELMQPEGEVYLAGEHMSYLNGWMAGAIESAWEAIERLHARAQANGA